MVIEWFKHQLSGGGSKYTPKFLSLKKKNVYMFTSSFSLVIECRLCQAHPKSQPAKLEHLIKTLTPSQSLVLYFSQCSNLRSVVRWLRPSLCLLLFFNLGQSIQYMNQTYD